MKKLFIVRHAKSDWSVPGQADELRQINPKGIQKTARIIEYLKRKEIVPDLIICSHAVRASQTAALIADGTGYDKSKIVVHPKIYSWEAEELFELFAEIPDHVESLMIIGHNPVLTHFSNFFIKPPIDWMPTSSVVALALPITSWDKIQVISSERLFYITPKMLS